jgi:hypothetical protein
MDEADWWAGVDKHDATHPGYRKMIEWAVDKHFASFDEMQAAYAKHGEVSL